MVRMALCTPGSHVTILQHFNVLQCVSKDIRIKTTTVIRETRKRWPDSVVLDLQSETPLENVQAFEERRMVRRHRCDSLGMT